MRKLDKYVSKYRVLCERDSITNKSLENGTNTYIACYKNVQIYRVKEDKLCLYAPYKMNKANILKKIKPTKIIDFYTTSMDTEIEFMEEDLEYFLEVFKPITKGKDIKAKNKHRSKVS